MNLLKHAIEATHPDNICELQTEENTDWLNDSLIYDSDI